MTIDPIAITISLALDGVREQSLGIWAGAIYHAYGLYTLDAHDIELLDRYGVTQDGVMHDATAEAIRDLYPSP